MTSRPVLVTGGDGFVGRHLCSELGDRALPMHADVTDADAVARTVRAANSDAVVHLAALSWVAQSWREPGRVWEVNVVGTVNVLDAVRRDAPDARVLVVSTGEVYGRAERVPTPESSPVAPVSPYAASKAAAELAAAQARSSGLDVVVARAFQHEGPGRDDRFAVGSWTRQLAELELEGGGALRVGSLDAERDITDVRDVCRAYRMLLDRSVEPGIYNVASGHAVSMRRVAELLVGMVDAEITLEVDPERIRPVDVPVVCGDPSRILQATGWRPQIPLEQTLADTLEAARDGVETARMAAR